MNRKVLSGALAGIWMLALSTTAAQAGSGGTPSALTSFFVCKTINGDNAARSVDIQAFNTNPSNPAGWGFTLQGVLIGNATLACSFARLLQPGTTTEISPQPFPFKDLKCYSISVPKSQLQTGTPPSYTVRDSLLIPNGGVDPDVTGSSLQYICAPANFNPNAQ